MDTNIISSLILSGAGIIISLIVSIIFGYIPRERIRKINLLHKELLNTYSDINEFIKLEQSFLKKYNITKINARKNLNMSANSEPKKVAKKIKELNLILK
jgi:Mg2+/citrate symporter